MMKYTIFYDANCSLCSHEISLIMKRNTRDTLMAAPLDDNIDMMASLNITREAAMTLLHITDENGNVYIGMDAIRLMYRECGWVWQERILALPLIKPLSEFGYKIFAKYRYLMPKTLLHKDAPQCDGDTCNLASSKRQSKT